MVNLVHTRVGCYSGLLLAISQKACGPVFLDNILVYPCSRVSACIMWAELGF